MGIRIFCLNEGFVIVVNFVKERDDISWFCIDKIFLLCRHFNSFILVEPSQLDILTHLLLLLLQLDGIALIVHEVHLILVLIRAIGLHLLPDISTFFNLLVNAFDTLHLGCQLVPAIQV